MPKFAAIDEQGRLLTVIVAPSKKSAEKLLNRECFEITDELEFSKTYAIPEESTNKNPVE